MKENIPQCSMTIDTALELLHRAAPEASWFAYHESSFHSTGQRTESFTIQCVELPGSVQSFHGRTLLEAMQTAREWIERNCTQPVH